MTYPGTAAAALPKEEAILERAKRRHPPALIAGIAILGTLLALSIFAPLLTKYSPIAQDPLHALLPPSREHLLGTDQLGRDVWSRLLYGSRIDFEVGFLAVLFPFCLGTIIGLAAGYFGGWADTFAMRSVDVVLAFPFFCSGDRDGVRARARHGEHLYRDHYCWLGVVCEDYSWTGARRKETGVRLGSDRARV